jgi:high-affinity nickel-transport protein
VTLRTRLAVVIGLLAAFNLGAWAWAAVAFQGKPVLLGIALVIYGLGLRHAVDADHIAAIDNVTRKLMNDGQRPVTVGFYFAMGHSSIVVFVTAAVAGLAAALGRFQGWQEIGGVVSTVVSAVFLIAIAVMNIFIFRSIYHSYRRFRRSGTYVEGDLDLLLNSRGFLSRLVRPLFRVISQSWQMFPLGFLFGLGFDTATEVAMFGVSTAQLSKGVPWGAIMAFPVLFAAGMSLVDTADGILMVGAYDWAFVKPMRKLYYNLTITMISILIAVFIGGVEALGLVRSRFALSGGPWDLVRTLDGDMNRLGLVVIGLFVGSWLASWLIYKTKNLDAYDLGLGAAD